MYTFKHFLIIMRGIILYNKKNYMKIRSTNWIFLTFKTLIKKKK